MADLAPLPPLQPVLPWITADTLAARNPKPRAWHVEGLLPGRTVTLLGGDGGTGKSLLALQLAAATAAARPWLGLPVTAGRAVYVSAEDDSEELHRRLADITQAEGIAFDDLERLTLRSLAGEDALLAHAQRNGTLTPTPLFRDLDQRLGDEAPALLVLDTLADLFPGDENNRAQARQFVGMLRGLAIRHDCTVLMLAHPSLSGLNSGTGTSGSTAWNNSVRSRLYLDRVRDDGYGADPDARTLTTKKANYGRTGGEIALRWQAGVFVAQEAETGLDRMAATAKAERVFLRLLRQFLDQGRRVNSKGGPNYAPKVFSGHPDCEGISKRAFGLAMERLLSGGKITIGQDGPPSRRVSYIMARVE